MGRHLAEVYNDAKTPRPLLHDITNHSIPALLPAVERWSKGESLSLPWFHPHRKRVTEYKIFEVVR